MRAYLLPFCLLGSILIFTACWDEASRPKPNVNEKPPVVAIDTIERTKPMLFEEQTLTAADGLEISADLYHLNDDAPVAVLCHQARSNKEEYKEIATRLKTLGFNCLALDQRSGGTLLGADNQTATRAIAAKLDTEYLDAKADIEAGIAYASKKYGKPVLLVGSSYSASLALVIANNNEQVKALAAFSPGEYFGEKLKVAKESAKLNKPCFITSSKDEAKDVAKLVSTIEKSKLTQFVPEAEGVHGAKALWEKNPSNKEYWEAFESFLKSLL